MELRHLRYFVTVAEELHFGRAARRLHLSQPPLSMQIKALEEELGVMLLLRNQRHVALTSAGEVFLKEAREILTRLDSAAEAARRAGRGETGDLRVGFVTIADYNVLPSILQRFRSSSPDIRLVLQEATTDVQLHELMDARMDVGFVLSPVGRAPGSAAADAGALLAALPVACCSPCARTDLMKRLADWPFILFPRHMATGLYDDIIGFCRQAGFSPQVDRRRCRCRPS